MAKLIIEQADREALIKNPARRSYRKTARIIAVEMQQDFEVETDRGVMKGVAGDYLVTNHPADDTSSDLWTISRERMFATYEEVTPPKQTVEEHMAELRADEQARAELSARFDAEGRAS